MAGHSHWKQIKYQKGAADQKRGALFSKLLKAISVAARDEKKPEFNPRLKSAIEKAKEYNVPNDNIERAISRSSEEKSLEELLVEVYGPGGVAFIIEAVTDNRNRTMMELKQIVLEHGGKIAEPGSVRWAFEKTEEGWKLKFPQPFSDEIQEKCEQLRQTLLEHDDVHNIVTSIDTK